MNKSKLMLALLASFMSVAVVQAQNAPSGPQNVQQLQDLLRAAAEARKQGGASVDNSNLYGRTDGGAAGGGSTGGSGGGGLGAGSGSGGMPTGGSGSGDGVIGGGPGTGGSGSSSSGGSTGGGTPGGSTGGPGSTGGVIAGGGVGGGGTGGGNGPGAGGDGIGGGGSGPGGGSSSGSGPSNIDDMLEEISQWAPQGNEVGGSGNGWDDPNGVGGSEDSLESGLGGNNAGAPGSQNRDGAFGVGAWSGSASDFAAQFPMNSAESQFLNQLKLELANMAAEAGMSDAQIGNVLAMATEDYNQARMEALQDAAMAGVNPLPTFTAFEAKRSRKEIAFHIMRTEPSIRSINHAGEVLYANKFTANESLNWSKEFCQPSAAKAKFVWCKIPG